MNEIHKRAMLYGGAALLVGCVGVAAAVVEAEADSMTLLSSIDVQLRLAHGIPQLDKQGRPLSAREEMVDEAIASLEAVERQMPGMAITAEFRGFAHMLKGEFEAAAACYARARDCVDCGDEQRDVLAFNQARMLSQAGDDAGALAVFERHAEALDSRFGQQRRIEQAPILQALGRSDDAVAELEIVLADASVEPMVWVQAGYALERIGRPERAEAAYVQSVAGAPIANYYMARLKLQQGDVDIAMECLERAFASAPADTARLIREESEGWQAVSEDERFVRLTRSVAATPGR